jgi:hypothetical protein
MRAPAISLKKGRCMCESCQEIDKRIEVHQQSLRSITDPSEIERIKQLIANLYLDRVRFHRNPER